MRERDRERDTCSTVGVKRDGKERERDMFGRERERERDMFGRERDVCEGQTCLREREMYDS